MIQKRNVTITVTDTGSLNLKNDTVYKFKSKKHSVVILLCLNREAWGVGACALVSTRAQHWPEIGHFLSAWWEGSKEEIRWKRRLVSLLYRSSHLSAKMIRRLRTDIWHLLQGALININNLNNIIITTNRLFQPMDP